MNKRNFLRVLAMVLVLAMTVLSPLAAGAAHVVGDLNGDGKISVFDAQLLLEAQAGLRQLTNAGGATAQNIVDYILGNFTDVDAGDMDGDGVIEIYTAAGLQTLHDDPNASYILMNDLDLTGTTWSPVAAFNGTFNGNGKTISNVVINTDAQDCRSSSIFLNQGFFADTESAAVIQDLHLRDVTLTTTENVRAVGLLVGSMRGTATGCTVTGSVIDTREAHTETNYIGVMVGRLLAGSSFTGGTSLSITDEKEVATTTGLCANAKLLLTSEDNMLQNGLAGWAYSASAISGQWTDTTYSSTLLTDVIQERQQKVVDYMHAQGTVAWTPSETMTFTSSNKAINQTYTAGVTYTGLPYNGHNGSLERFLSVMESQDENGVYTAQALGSGGWTVDGVLNTTGDANGEWSDTGFYMYMGNDCSSAVGWSWLQVSSVVAADVDTHETPYKGGVYVATTPYMIPNETNRTNKGIYPVGNWTAHKINDEGKQVTAFELSDAAYQCTDQVYASDVLNLNGYETMLEAYAQTHKADALVNYTEQWYTDGRESSQGGHARLVVADPIVIRESDGSINDTASYMVITEQGVGFSATSTSRWNINKKYTFKALSGIKSDGTADATSRTYLPVTIRALKDDEVREIYLRQNPAGSIISPVEGGIYTYHRIQSVTVTVRDSAGNVYYKNQVFTGVNLSGYRGQNNNADLAELHADAFYAAAAESGMVEGNTYNFNVDVLLSTGESRRLVNKQNFVYTIPTTEIAE